MTTELSALYVRLVEQTARASLDPRATLAVLAEGGRLVGGACGAITCYLPPGTATVHTVGTSAELQSLAVDAAIWNEGPSVGTRLTGRSLLNLDMTTQPVRVRWPHWTPRALNLKLAMVTALPLMTGPLTESSAVLQPAGALVLLDSPDTCFDEDALTDLRDLARTASHLLSLQTELAHQRSLSGQLQHALHSRVLIEQAKGILAARRHITTDAAFALLRGHARSHGLKIALVARAVIDNGGILPASHQPVDD
ncbi:ANTAR domain-containing protein [Streptomyces sp. NPDC001904]|uniref:ANTAR domain-containing response regulator n=1 Tax=Streptomyces sp. NPDC001904 TaxID=3154531 RepID=UPI00331CAF9C